MDICTDACIHSNQGVGPEGGDSNTHCHKGAPMFSMQRGSSRHWESGVHAYMY